MNKIEEMIKKLCPNGVEYKELSELCDIMDSYRKPITKEKRISGIYPYYGANGIQDYIDSYIFDGTYILMGEDGSVINKDNTPVLNWATGKIWVNNHAHVLKEKSDMLLRFLYYYLQTIDISAIVRGTPPKITQQDLKILKIPVPPIAVQQEIVKVLDTFSELTAELTAELAARKKQYAYYKHKLLSFENLIDLSPNGVEYKELGEICYISAGGDIPKEAFSKTKTEIYTVPIISNGVGYNAIYGYTNIPKIVEPSITIAARGTIGYCALRETPYYPIVRVISLTPKENIILKYLKFIIEIQQYKIPQTGIPQLTIPMIKNKLIPVPPLEVQEYIVNILDKFDSLVNDIMVGLPAEIAARQKQYAYYRDKLLTFASLK